MCEECNICRTSPVAKALYYAIKNEKWDGKHPDTDGEYRPRLKIGNNLPVYPFVFGYYPRRF